MRGQRVLSRTFMLYRFTTDKRSYESSGLSVEVKQTTQQLTLIKLHVDEEIKLKLCPKVLVLQLKQVSVCSHNTEKEIHVLPHRSIP